MRINEDVIAIRDKILETVKDCEKIILFGSYAYGEPGDNSDYDFYIVLNDNEEDPHFTIANVYKCLRPFRRKRSIDILANHKNSFEKWNKMPTIEKTIADKGVVLYERSIG
jgi:predicted nucleotidyltransferase